MVENEPTNVFVAFEILREKVEAEIDLINKVGARALERGDYKGAGELLNALIKPQYSWRNWYPSARNGKCLWLLIGVTWKKKL